MVRRVFGTTVVMWLILVPKGVLADMPEPDLIYESWQRTDYYGDVIEAFRPSSEHLDPAILDEATGTITPPQERASSTELETFDYQHAGDGEVTAGYRIVARERRFLSVQERIDLVNARRGLYPDDELDAQISSMLESPIEDQPEAIGEAARFMLAAHYTPQDIVVLELCGPPLSSYRLPAELLRFELSSGLPIDEVREEGAAILSNLRDARAFEASNAQAPLIDAVIEHSGEVLSRSPRRNCIHASLPFEEVEALGSDHRVRTLIVSAPIEPAESHEADGVDIRQGVQLEEYWLEHLASFNAGMGEAASSKPGGYNDITVAVIDEGFEDRHTAWRDTSADANFQRIHGRWYCSGAGSGCANGNCAFQGNGDLPFDAGNWTGENTDHGTSVLGVLMGDLTDGQELTSVIPAAEQEDYSGLANEAGVLILQSAVTAGFICGNRAAAFDKVAELEADIVTTSVCSNGSRVDCNGNGVIDLVEPRCSDGPVGPNNSPIAGQTCTCRGGDGDTIDEVNDVFRDGKLVFKAAGNEGAGTACCPCTVTSPGTAVGAFTVGATGSPADDSHDDVRNANLRTASSEGGGEMNRPGAQERTIVDIVAPGCRHNLPECEDETAGQACNLTAGTSDYSTLDTESICGTSFAAPTVAAAAADFKDHWVRTKLPTTWLDDAGMFKTLMLSMGDRANGAASFLDTGFDRRWGAGRLKMRHFSAQGMDTPWGRNAGWTLIDDGEVYERWLTIDGVEAALSGDVDALKVVIWWYEPRTEDAVVAAADIVLSLMEFNADCSVHVTSHIDLSYDVKKMVFRGNKNPETAPPASDDPGGKCWKMRISGLDVTPDDENGGIEQRKVYWAFYYEDTDRDDVDGPTLATPIQPGDVERP